MRSPIPPAVFEARLVLFRRLMWGTLFGRDVAVMRRRKGRSVREAARRADMTTAAWKAVEAGRVPRTWEQLCQLATGLEESREEMASIVLLYAGAWGRKHGLPTVVRRMKPGDIYKERPDAEL